MTDALSTNSARTTGQNFPEETTNPDFLASRGERLRAAFYDGLLQWVLIFPLWHFSGAAARIFRGGVVQPSVEIFAWAVFALAIFAALQAWPLSRTGQTWGKKVVGIRIVRLQGDKPPLSALLFRRYALPKLAIWLPWTALLWLLDLLFVFGAKRRCLHDRMAGTTVILAAEPYRARLASDSNIE